MANAASDGSDKSTVMFGVIIVLTEAQYAGSSNTADAETSRTLLWVLGVRLPFAVWKFPWMRVERPEGTCVVDCE